jgi:hypothetical protein
MPHRRLCGSRGYAPFAQKRSESVPQGVNVDGSPSFVAFRISGFAKVTVQDAQQARRNIEERKGGR